jgi:molybdenum cofactor cytidylyltransferase
VKVGAVVLAAGGSSRLGRPKQLLTLDGESLVKRAARVALDAGANPVIVVLGADHKLIESTLAGLPSVRLVINQEWQTGLASSFAAGLRAFIEIADCDGAVVMLADQPLVDAAALQRLIAAFDARHRLVAASYEGTIGVPAVFGREYLAELLHLTGDAGAGPWLRSRSSEVTPVSLDSGALDIDTPTDAESLK